MNDTDERRPDEKEEEIAEEANEPQIKPVDETTSAHSFSTAAQPHTPQKGMDVSTSGEKLKESKRVKLDSTLNEAVQMLKMRAITFCVMNLPFSVNKLQLNKLSPKKRLRFSKRSKLY